MNRIIRAFMLASLLSTGAFADPVNINTADARTLAKELSGIGLSRAQAIVDYREKNGPFKSVDELAKVKGIGTKVVEQNRANIRLEKTDKSKGPAKPADKSASSE
ncbi:MAG TPA: ComEA family DNA-binding protein [Steroidobacteraceae bacterium]|nr:ComEA family DNA-binding protein [Steroidobacteraceae bacterium]